MAEEDKKAKPAAAAKAKSSKKAVKEETGPVADANAGLPEGYIARLQTHYAEVVRQLWLKSSVIRTSCRFHASPRLC